MGHTPSTAGTFRKKFRKNSGKTPETLWEHFLEFPSRVRLGCPKPYNLRHLRLPERFQNSLPPSTAGDASFFRIDSGEGLSELLSWNSQQYWGYFWYRNCFKYVRSNSVPSRVLPNSCLQNPGRGPKSNRTSRLFPGSFWRRTNVQQLTCKIDLSKSFYYLFFSFVLIELKPFVLKGKVLGEKFWKSAKKC